MSPDHTEAPAESTLSFEQNAAEMEAPLAVEEHNITNEIPSNEIEPEGLEFNPDSEFSLDSEFSFEETTASDQTAGVADQATLTDSMTSDVIDTPAFQPESMSPDHT
ncbi:hypothetical protein GN156_24690, partial [bacterium LRH843]|nr:hypothetical protein [bacterium LRH843]